MMKYSKSFLKPRVLENGKVNTQTLVTSRFNSRGMFSSYLIFSYININPQKIESPDIRTKGRFDDIVLEPQDKQFKMDA